MQAIWAHEPPDHRFFRLHKVAVPVFEEESKTYTISSTPHPLRFLTKGDLTTGNIPDTEFPVQVDTNIDPDIKTATLAEVADLDTLLGFKGNYMMFPLKKSNPLTNFMMDPYIDRATGELIDPDPLGNMNLDDFSKYVCCLKREVSEDRFNELKPELKTQLEELLKAPHRTREDLIVPTSSLYIDALPGEHPLLEDFKLMHRAIDVKAVQAEVRGSELENVRAAARLLAGEREDPDIEKKIVIEGSGEGIVVSPGDE